MAWLLLPGYFRGEITTAYEVLGQRWGDGARRTASAIFLVTRALATAVRLFAGAIPLAVITGWSYPAAILAVGVATVIYTSGGGLRAVVWGEPVDLARHTVFTEVKAVTYHGLRLDWMGEEGQARSSWICEVKP